MLFFCKVKLRLGLPKWLGMGLRKVSVGLEIPARALSVMSIYLIDYVYKVVCPAGLGKGT